MTSCANKWIYIINKYSLATKTQRY